MPLLSRQRLFCAKVEGTLGTPEAIDNTCGVMNVVEMSRTANTPFTAIPAQNGLGMRKGVPGARMGTMEIMHHLVGNGTTGLPYVADLLKGCGGAFSTQVFSPVVDNGVGLTTMLFRGSGSSSRAYKMSGAMGNCVMTFKAGEIVPCRYTFTGKVYSGATQTLPTVTHPTVTPPRFVGGTFTIGGTTYVIDQLEFDMGNQIIMREDPTDTSGSGYISAWISNRSPVVRISPEALPLATKDWDDFFYSSTTAALSLSVGSASNNTIAIAAPALQLTKPPADGDRNGIYTDVLEFSCNQNSDTEDSEYTITFS